MIVALEGLPGAGKTTAAGLVAARLDAAVLIETTADHPFLEQVYDDAHRDDLSLELSFLLIHSNPFRLLDRSRLTVTDFSPAKDLLFAADMLDAEDLKLFESVYEHLYRRHPLPEVVVYLDAPPRLCLDRVAQRMKSDESRAFEAGLTLDRLERMQRGYEHRFRELGKATLKVDVDVGTGREDLADLVVARLRDRGFA